MRDNAPIHVYPLNDLHEHVTEGYAGGKAECPCNPRIVWEGFTRIIVHNSWDGRELLERKYAEIEQ